MAKKEKKKRLELVIRVINGDTKQISISKKD